MINIKLIRAAVEAAITPTHDISMLEDVAMEAYTAILYMITDVIPTTTRIIYNIHKKLIFTYCYFYIEEGMEVKKIFKLKGNLQVKISVL